MAERGAPLEQRSGWGHVWEWDIAISAEGLPDAPDGEDGEGSEDGARTGHRVQDAVAAVARARIAGAIAGATDEGSAPAMFITRDPSRRCSGREHVGDKGEVHGRVEAEPDPPMAMPTTNPLKLLARAITNRASPNTTDAEATKTLRRPVRSDSHPPTSDATTTTLDMARVARNICRGTSGSLLPSFLIR